ncbi:scarecrow-like protein 9 [Aegilops tauschii subsp. strangulata]|uniref:scarecrow-like protein 9 n=1 Tax=Aegilops tauschii subsp. strangulata TaxID=200361 RepID=UPI001ABD3CF9|nr:scarecrow-like protein 14 [Aegilops tauschii subsp. strangulata]
MGSGDKSSSADFHGIMANTAGCDAYCNQEFIKSSTAKVGHVSWGTSSSYKVYSPQLFSVSCDETSAGWRLISVAEHPKTDSDVTLSHIEQMLMQDTDDKVRAPHGETAIRTMEEPFYELLGQKYPVLPGLLPLCGCDRLNILENGSVSRLNNGQLCNNCSVKFSSDNYHSNGSSQASQAPWTLSAIVGEAIQFPLGVEEMGIGLNINGLSISPESHSPHMNDKDTTKHAPFHDRSRKVFPGIEELDLLEGRRNKQIAIFSDEPVRNEAFDKVLLCSENKPVDEDIILQRAMADISTKYAQKEQGRKPARRTKRGKTRKKKEVVDLRSLLIHCAEAVSVNNRSLASDILKSIRQHCSPSGDDTQRLAFYLADCLEIRLSGSGSQINQKVITTPTNAAHILKLCHLCFTWPSLLKQFADREGGPPKLRITGSERIERPESYKKWNVRSVRARFEQLPLNPTIVKGIQSMVRQIYHKDFFVDEEDQCLVLGWKGRILYALSTWKPSECKDEDD